VNSRGVEAQSTLGGQDIFARKNMSEKLTECPNFTSFLTTKYQNTLIFMIFAQKINQIPKLYMIFTRKMPEFYIIARKIFIPEFLGAHAPPPFL